MTDIVKRLRKDSAISYSCANCDELLKNEAADEIERLREALQYAVDKYGKPGGPWNVPSDPGTWIAKAKSALKGGKQ